MTLTISPVVEIRFGVGPTFTSGLTLGSATQGVIGTNVLGTSNASVIDITRQCTKISTRRGRDQVFDSYNSSSCSVTLVDSTGDWNPANTSSPYYGNILPMRQVRVTTNYQGTTYFLFFGYISSIDWSFDRVAQVAYVTLTCEDIFRALNLLNVSTIPGTSAGQLPGDRIHAILDAINWPAQLRDIDTGYVTLQADSGTERTALAALQEVETAELGALYLHPSGVLTFRDRYAIAALASSAPTIFDDDGTDINYQEIDVNLDEQNLANNVTVTRNGGTDQTLSDSTSIDQYFKRSLNRSGLIMDNDEQAYGQANMLLQYRKNPKMRVDSIELDLTENSSRILAGLQLDMNKPMTVYKTLPGGKFAANVTVQSISHDISPENWRMKIGTAYPLTTGFILGSSTYGVLGTSSL